jgi:hypothetical protein
MKSYRYSRTTVELDEESIAELFNVLGIVNRPDVSHFMDTNYPEDRTFYQFATQVLSMNGVSAVIAPNKWEPENLFYQLKRVLKDHTIELLEETENREYEAYDVSFSLDGANESVTVDTADPSQLFDTFNKYLSDHQFIRLESHLKERRSVEWLLTPMPFDSDKFRQLTGCSKMRLEWKPSLTARYTEGRTPTVSQVEKLTRKVFFTPSTLCVAHGEVKYLSYTHPSTSQPMHWAGRVLPGQTFTEGIAAELEKTLDYRGKFEFYNFRFQDYAFDKSGRQIERYRLTLKLLEPVMVSETSTGLNVHLASTPPAY